MNISVDDDLFYIILNYCDVTCVGYLPVGTCMLPVSIQCIKMLHLSAYHSVVLLCSVSLFQCRADSVQGSVEPVH